MCSPRYMDPPDARLLARGRLDGLHDYGYAANRGLSSAPHTRSMSQQCVSLGRMPFGVLVAVACAVLWSLQAVPLRFKRG